jgi:propanol-preferring alcohol dehydrogenase
MVLERTGAPLRALELPVPEPAAGEVLIEVEACAVCRTDLHILDGELPRPKLPLVLGHELVGRVIRGGAAARRFAVGARVGVPWLASACGSCGFCLAERENLCRQARFTGYDVDGGYAERAVADERFCFAIPEGIEPAQAAPLLCAGLIGWRALAKAEYGKRVGLYGFGAAAHLLTQILAGQGREVFAFTRRGDTRGQDFARRLGAAWAGDSSAPSPEPLDAAIIFAPVGELVPLALASVAPGGIVVCGGIHMSDIPSFPYRLLWEERSLVSVANLTRRDGEQFFAALRKRPLLPQVTALPLIEANEALWRLREGQVEGALVLEP